jgi:formylglycine-generating enzyme required for sulfatase activity
MPFVKIPKGNFTMGDRYGAPEENPPHQVAIATDFYLSAFPVTQEQYTAVVGKKNYGEFIDPLLPATQLTYHDCQTFFRHLSLFDKDHQGRLPTEAEWEYACRAGSLTEYCTGDGDGALNETGVYSGNIPSPGPQLVGGRRRNAWGLYDMHGNVWEWCHDYWDPAAYRERLDGVFDPTSRRASVSNVIRGGSWGARAIDCRSACRGSWHGLSGGGYIGFRACFSLVPQFSCLYV